MTDRNQYKLHLVPEITCPDIQCRIGSMYFFGRGVQQNMPLGVTWYAKSADQGNMEAQCNLGFCYHRGAGVPQDIRKSLYWYGQAAQQGDAFAAYYLGLIYEKGDGVASSLTTAFEWYKKAAEHGHSAATTKMASLSSGPANVLVLPLSARQRNKTTL